LAGCAFARSRTRAGRIAVSTCTSMAEFEQITLSYAVDRTYQR
jgi:hypothetical protein